MIIEKNIEVKINSSKVSYFRELGYEVSSGDICLIEVKDLTPGSNIRYSVECDLCKSQFTITNKIFRRHNSGVLPINSDFIICGRCKSKKTCLKKYGVDNPNKSKDIRNKSRKTCLEKYGVDSPLKNQNILDKIKKTNIERYGVDIASKNINISDKIKKTNREKWDVDGDDIISRTKKTNIKRYGVDSPIKNNIVLSKMINTNISRYGVENVFSSQEIKNRIKKTNLLKYGFDHPSKNDHIKEKKRLTCNTNNGFDYFFQTSEFKNRKKNNDIKIARSLFDEYGCELISYEDKIYQVMDAKCGHTFDTTSYLFYQRTRKKHNHCTVCLPIGSGDSFGEVQVYEYLLSLNIRVDRNRRDLIAPKEIDLYLPDHKLAIEFNGLYWHSDNFKNKRYHIDKTNQCNEVGIELIHIWEDEWINRSDIIKSILLNRIGLIKLNIGARKCRITEVSNKESLKFYKENHIQGGVNSKYNIGLMYKDELVSLMSFTNRKINSKSEFELTRFCNRKNMIVNGSASKIFNYFKLNFDFEVINTYSDISLFNGNLYKQLGFIDNGSSYLNYWWCIGIKKYHRFTFNKKRLVNEGYDTNLTENEIMRNRGYYKLYGCGHKKWIYRTYKPDLDDNT